MIVVMACYAKAVDQLFKLQKLRKLPSSDLISINGSWYYWCYHRRDAKEWSCTVSRMQICSRRTEVEVSLIWADNRHWRRELTSQSCKDMAVFSQLQMSYHRRWSLFVGASFYESLWNDFSHLWGLIHTTRWTISVITVSWASIH